MTLMENDATSLHLVVEGRRLVVESAAPFYALVMATEPQSGHGAFVNVEVGAGRTQVPLPLHRPGVLVELVDVATGALRGATTLT